MLQTHNTIDNYVISGFPYHYYNLKNDYKNYFKQIELVKKNFCRKAQNLLFFCWIPIMDQINLMKTNILILKR